MKDTNNYLLHLGAGAIMAGAVASTFALGPFASWFYGIGATSIAFHIAMQFGTDWRRFFVACGLYVKEGDNVKTPALLDKTETAYGYILRFKPVAGLSSKDIIAKQDKIEEFINARVEISYWDKNIFIKAYTKSVADNVFELVETKGPVELVIGRGYRGVETLNLSGAESNVHLLVAGTTGGGKTSLLRAIITTLICTKDPKDLELYLLDLKGTEFRIFDRCEMVKGFARSIDESKKLLRQIRSEVDRRNNLFYDADVADILEYNRKYKRNKLPHRLVVADEFHLLRTEKNKTSIALFEDLAAVSRSVGIHLILCTQRPSADVITGLLKANIPTVIGLKTNNELNSRIILGESDGDLAKLRGKGHALMHTGLEKTELQGMWLSPEDAKDMLEPFYAQKKGENLGVEKVENNFAKVDDLDFL